MKKLILVGMFLFSNIAMAATAEKILPADATNVHVVRSVIDWVGVGSKPFEGGSSLEGPQSETVFAKRLVVTVQYNSKDTSDVNQTIYDNGPQPDRTPTVTFSFELSPSKLAEVEAGRVPAASLVSKSLAVKSIVVDDPNYQYQCRYDMDSNAKVDDNCQENPKKVTLVRPVLKLDVATN